MKYLLYISVFLLIASCSNEPKGKSVIHHSKNELKVNTKRTKAEKMPVFVMDVPPPVEEEYPEEIYFIEFPKVEAEFPGGQAEMMRFIYGEIEYPEIAVEMGIQGTVYAEFVVGKDGGVGRIKIVKGVDRSIDREVMRAIRKMPKWSPAEEEGRKIESVFVVPVKFRLD